MLEKQKLILFPLNLFKRNEFLTMQKILIVEDDKKLRKELEAFLTKNGFIAKGLEKFDNTIQEVGTMK